MINRSSWQCCLPQHLLSELVGYFTHLKRPLWFKNTFIRWFVKRYEVNLQESVLTQPEDYDCFHDFFTRPLKPGVRNTQAQPDVFISPVDGFVSAWGNIKANKIFQAKGFDYTLETLLANDPLSHLFQSGQFITLYLAPKNYHRVHMPFDGTLRKMTYVPGKLFSVNPTTVNSVPDVFARNERVVCYFDTPNGKLAVIFVGAMIVGSMTTAWHGVVNPARTRKQAHTWHYEDGKTFQQADELGYFSLGSTAIVLMQGQSWAWAESLTTDGAICLGDSLATI